MAMQQTWQSSLKHVQQSIRDALQRTGQNRSNSDITVIAATKYTSPEDCFNAVSEGITDLGENRLPSLREKQEYFQSHGSGDQFGADGMIESSAPCWHFIGRVQSRQSPEIAERVSVIHSICSLSATKRLARWVDEGGSLPECFLQINIAEDPAKDGLLAKDVNVFLESLPSEITISGLMTMPAYADNPELSRVSFSQLRELSERLQTEWEGRHPFGALSMGTTQDFVVAVEEGATHIRLGRILASKGE